MTSEPVVAFEPDHEPLPEHDVALDDDHVRVELVPEVTVDGDAESETVGAGGVTGGVTGGVVVDDIVWSESSTTYCVVHPPISIRYLP